MNQKEKVKRNLFVWALVQKWWLNNSTYTRSENGYGFKTPSLKTGVENNIFKAEIGLGFREPGGTAPRKIPGNTPPPPQVCPQVKWSKCMGIIDNVRTRESQLCVHRWRTQTVTEFWNGVMGILIRFENRILFIYLFIFVPNVVLIQLRRLVE